MRTWHRIAGYAGVLTILLIVVGTFRLVRREFLDPDRIIRVRFSELGTLRVEAPVAQNGVPVGKVKQIHLQDGQPLLEIELFKRGFIAEDSRFVNFNHSLMGERMVVLVPGRSVLPLDESQIQTGIFANGVAETMHRVTDLLELVTRLASQSEHLFNGPDAALSPRLLNDLEKTALALNRLAKQVDQNGKSLSSNLDAWIRAENSMTSVVSSKSSQLGTLKGQSESILTATLLTEKSVKRVLESAERILESTRDSGGAAHAWLYDRKVYEDLRNSIKGFQAALDEIREKEPGRAIGWKNLHFFRAKN